MRKELTTMFRFKNKSKNNGPVKAMTSVYATKEKMSPAKSKDSKKSKKHGSKDDSQMLDSAGKVKWKANPYATIKMWRPITMSTSITSEDDVYQNFTQFQNLHEMSKTKSNGEHAMPNGVDRTVPVPLKSPSQPLSIQIPDASPPSEHVRQRKRTVSDSSYDIISDTATDSVKDVLRKLYKPADYRDACEDIDRFQTELGYTLESLQNSRLDKNQAQFEVCREELFNQAKQLINDAKLFVSSANNSHDKLTHYLNVVMHTLARVFLHSQSVMLLMESLSKAQHLGSEITKVCQSLKGTISAANVAVGKSLNDPLMKHLMRQAASLAGMMSVLLKEIKNMKSESE